MYNFKILCQVQSIVDVLIADLTYIVNVNLIRWTKSFVNPVGQVFNLSGQTGMSVLLMSIKHYLK